MTLWDPYARADLFKIMQQWVNEARVDADTWGNARKSKTIPLPRVGVPS